MESKLFFGDAAAFSAPALALFAVDTQTEKNADPQPMLLTASREIGSAAGALLASGEFKASLGEVAVLHAPAGLKAERLLLAGLGKAKDLSPDMLRKAAGAAVRSAKSRNLRSLAVAFPDIASLSQKPAAELLSDLAARAIVEGAEIAEPDWDIYRSDRKDRAVESFTLIADESAPESQRTGLQRGFDEGLIVAAAQNFARSLVNEPGNVLTPTVLGTRTKAMCDEAGLQCEVYNSEKIQHLKMGAFWAVAKGSAEPPALIVMTYEPANAPADGPVLGLVGKGITFDTGGISIKPADGMEKMKYDMAGAAAMIGAMHAIARLKPAVKVISVICSAENMPDGRAYKPGDVVTAMSGKTIEVVNTDAEGRLVLSDGLHYAKTLGCTHLIDAATLTGAVSIALGHLNFGVFSNDDATCERFMEGLKISGEKAWRLPCTDDYRDHIKSEIADIMNTGKNRYGGAISGAIFLKEFVGETPWVHLDIAGLAWNEAAKPWLAYGPSGIAVRSIIEWVRSFAA
jgi:leucyl aminopeptidase